MVIIRFIGENKEGLDNIIQKYTQLKSDEEELNNLARKIENVVNYI
jgi:hypothetical protein